MIRRRDREDPVHGGSSFTGHWFIRELAAAGHEVTATFRREPGLTPTTSPPPRRAGGRAVSTRVRGVRDERFVSLAGEDGWDLLAHHAAEATNYRSQDFDAVAALQRNTANLGAVLRALRERLPQVLLTGSVFESGEGAGSDGLPAFSPYGPSKGLTAEVFRHHCRAADVHLGKFVIPNPFGPLEEPRYTAYHEDVARSRDAHLRHARVRPGQHLMSLLAKAYAQFAGRLPDGSGFAQRT